MKRTTLAPLIIFAGVLFLLTGCMNNNNEGAAPARDGDQRNNVEEIEHINSENNRNTTPTGEDSNIYDLPDEKNQHDQGISTHLEYRLAGSDIRDIKVFAIDDTVVLADTAENTNNNGKLEQAKGIMQVSFGDKVQVLTTANPKAPELIERIKQNITGKSTDYAQLGNDIQALFGMTAEKR